MNNDKHLNELIIEDRDKKDLGVLIKKPNKSPVELLTQEALQRRIDEKANMDNLRKYHGLSVAGGAHTSRYEQQRIMDDGIIDAYRNSKRVPRHY
ncbi:MAG TPA: hypothetical protein VI790_03730 [Candidatus Nanoarchaeia archaeon]|nr:hypothetical protein [Candidatus Nanoarchaeia archaeon]